MFISGYANTENVFYFLNSPPDLTRGRRSTRLWVDIKYPLIWDLMLHPNNTKLLFLTLGLPSNQRHCNFEEHFSPSPFCGDPQTILLDMVWPKILMVTALGMDTT